MVVRKEGELRLTIENPPAFSPQEMNQIKKYVSAEQDKRNELRVGPTFRFMHLRLD